MRGLGDLIARITHATGVDKLAKALFGEDCGCDERQEFLNKIAPFSAEKKSRIYALAFVKKLEKQSTIEAADNGILWDLYRQYINPRRKTTTCSSCVRAAIQELKQKLDGDNS